MATQKAKRKFVQVGILWRSPELSLTLTGEENRRTTGCALVCPQSWTTGQLNSLKSRKQNQQKTELASKRKAKGSELVREMYLNSSLFELSVQLTVFLALKSARHSSSSTTRLSYLPIRSSWTPISSIMRCKISSSFCRR